MNNLRASDYQQLLPRSQHAAFNQLTGKLKDLFRVRLLQAETGVHINVAIIALDIIIKFDMKDESLRKKRDRFFIEFLSVIKAKTETTLQKVLEITKKGFFSDFLNHVDSRKKEYRKPDQIIGIVNDFHTQILPALIIRKENNEMISLQPENAQSSLPLQEMHEKLMRCRTYFALPKLAWEFLTLLPLDKKWKNEVYAYFFHLLDVEHNLDFDDFEKSQVCHAIFRLHSPKRKKLFEHCSEIDLREFVNLCVQLKSNEGEEILENYFTSLSQSSDSNINEMMRGLKLLLKQAKNPNFYAFIDQWEMQNYGWSKLFELHKSVAIPLEIEIKNFNVQDDVQQRLHRFKKDPTVTQPLSDSDLQLISRQYQKIDELCHQHDQLEFNQLMNLAHRLRQAARQGAVDEANRLLLIAIGRLAIRLEFKLYPYSTQILALLGLFADGKSRQAQVKTGEGKSMIVALWAFVMAMECRAVDIITSARYLAVRDHDHFAHFFQRCGITTGHICYDGKLPKHFQPQILYGPAFDFEFAWMEDLLYGSKLYEERLKNPIVSRNFDALCVDESDNLLIDAFRNGARMSFPAYEIYDWVYAPILSFVDKNMDLVKNDLKEAIPLLRKYLTEQVSEKDQRNCMLLPDKKLKRWMRSARIALTEYSENVHYVIKKKRNAEGQLVKAIQIVDIPTGRISEVCRWEEGIHEFLEVKHDLSVAKESLNPLSISHAVFYPFYKTISALTGTAERFQTREIYQIESFDVPPHRELQRVDLPPLITENRISHLSLIIEQTKKYIGFGRPILILCPTIKETKQLAISMQAEKIEYQLLNEVQEELEHVILSQAGTPGKVTIATNAAGRGTDIILSPESLLNGGLHVLLSFFPDSKRVEDQAIGRAGRQGQPGSSQIILNKEDPEIKVVIDEIEKKLTDEEVMELLSRERESNEKSRASLHFGCAELERFLASKTDVFFKQFRDWADYIDQEEVLETFAQKLSPIKLRSNVKFDFTHVGTADLLLAEECKRLLTEKPGMVAWKVFLKTKLADRLKKKVLNEWTITFYKPACIQIRQNAFNIRDLKFQIANNIKQNKELWRGQNKEIIYDLVAKEMLKNLHDNIETIKNQMTQTFDAHQNNWEKYLVPDGLGLFVYMKDVMGIDLISILSR